MQKRMLQVLCKEDAEVVSQASQRHLPVRGELKSRETSYQNFLCQEYYGENVLHMGCVAEDASLVKWLLDIGSDIHR